LASVLQQQQAVVKNLINRRKTGNTDNPAH
jgi:hypothetical protein